jgi:DNA-binding GntR family transcriptional regulator
VKEHRYARIARDLAARITSGKLAVGEALPTEAALCKSYGVSRYTAREALRQLREAGLIRRRPRAGTTVAAIGTATAFSLPVSSAADLLRYATDTRFFIEQRAPVKADAELMALLECRRGQEWIRLSGVRRRPGVRQPLCLVSVYLASPLADLARRLPRATGVIYPLVEKALGTRIAWIGQRIEALPLEPAHAARLGARAGTCGLRVRRYYYDASERLLEMSDSVHDGARFAYEMRLRRD